MFVVGFFFFKVYFPLAEEQHVTLYMSSSKLGHSPLLNANRPYELLGRENLRKKKERERKPQVLTKVWGEEYFYSILNCVRILLFQANYNTVFSSDSNVRACFLKSHSKSDSDVDMRSKAGRWGVCIMHTAHLSLFRCCLVSLPCCWKKELLLF